MMFYIKDVLILAAHELDHQRSPLLRVVWPKATKVTLFQVKRSLISHAFLQLKHNNETLAKSPLMSFASRLQFDLIDNILGRYLRLCNFIMQYENTVPK